MAYAATVTITRTTHRGARAYRVLVTETECATASEWNTSSATGSVTGRTPTLPPNGRIVRVKVYKISGSATTVAPVLARATGITAAGLNALAVFSAASSVDDSTGVPYSGGSTLYGRSTPDAGTDNAITTDILILEGGGY